MQVLQRVQLVDESDQLAGDRLGAFSESRADLEAAFAGSGLLVPTPRGERVVLP